MKEHLGIKMPSTHVDIFASVCRPASVIRTRTTSVCRPAATMRSRFVVASPAVTSSTIMSIENQCARRIRLGVAVTAPGKQFEGAAAVRIGTAIVASGRHRCTVTIIAPTRHGHATGRDLSQGDLAGRVMTN